MLFYVPEEVKYETDFYDYLDSEANMTRYTVPLDFLTKKLGEKFSLVELNCLRGSLLKYLNPACTHFGIDSSLPALEYCRKKYPNNTFLGTEVFDEFCNTHKNSLDLVMIANGYIVRRFRDPNSPQEDTEYVISKLISTVLKKQGLLSVNPHFFYRDHPDYSLFKQFEFWLTSIENKLNRISGFSDWQLIFKGMSVQLGVDEFIRKQSQKTDWFLADPQDPLANRHAGTYIASVHLIFQI